MQKIFHWRTINKAMNAVIAISKPAAPTLDQ